MWLATGSGVASLSGVLWTTYNEFNSPLLSDDTETVRLLADGNLYFCTRTAGVGLLKE
jgi:hypothetical protein